MSFRTKVIALGSIFVVLLGLYVVGLVASPRQNAQRSAEALLFPGLKTQSVGRIEITSGSEGIALVKLAQWMIEDRGASLPASQEHVQDLIAAIASLNRGTLVTRSSGAASSLGLGDQPMKRIVVSDSTGKPLCEVRVGKDAVGQGFYVQAGKAADVWQTGQTLSSSLTTERAYWADLRVLPSGIQGNAVIALTVTSSTPKGFSWTASREKDSQNQTRWVLAGGSGASLEQAKIDSIANAVAGLTGSDFATEATQAAALASPTASVEVSLSDNRSFTIRFGAKAADGRYPCSLEKGRYSYLVPEWRVKEILLDRTAITSGSR